MLRTGWIHEYSFTSLGSALICHSITFNLNLSDTGPPPPLPPLQPSGMDAPPNSMTSSVPTIVTSGMRSSLPLAALPRFPPGNSCVSF